MKKQLSLVFALLFLIAGCSMPAVAGQAQEQTQGQAQNSKLVQTLGQVQGQAQTQGQALVQTAAANQAQRADAELFMHIGSPVAFANGKLLSLDKDSPDLSPIIHQTRTLVPLRVISEYFGAEVGYDPAKAEATIRFGGHVAVFPVGKSHYTLDGVERALDVETLLVAGRAFVPMRVICQEVLGYAIDYRDGLIYVAKSAALTEDLIQSVKSRIGMYVRSTGIEELALYMDNYATRYEYGWGDDVLVMEDASLSMAEAESGRGQAEPIGVPSAPVMDGASTSAAPPAPAPLMDQAAESAEQDYSSTNVQVEGIDEGDIIKTDGKYIYIIASNQLRVVDADSLTLAGTYDLGNNAHAQEMYIDKDRLVVIGSRYGQYNSVALAEPDSAASARWARAETNYTYVRVLDTSNVADIKSFRYYEVEGSMNTSRKKGDYVYLISGFYQWYRPIGIDPRPLAGEGGVLEPMPIERIMIMPGNPGNQFLTVSAVNIRNASERVSSETIAGSGYVVYMSSDNLYLAINDFWQRNKQGLNIARFSIDGAKIGYVGSCVVEGNVGNQFSMDEYEGFLRVATTVNWPQLYNNLYVIDANMDVVGQVAAYAEEERIYSARFLGDRGYVVTFREVDPLFVFDLSDPKAPRITGELKVPGFSTYLHPVSRDVLLGVGRDVYDIFRTDRDGNQIVIGQNTGGIKISLFDVSDMGKPREIDTLVLGDYGETELLYNHRAAMFKADEGILGFCGSAYADMGGKHFQGAFLISYGGNKLAEAGRIEYENPYTDYSKDSNLLYTGQRLIYIGDTLYYMQDGILRSFDLETLAPKASLRLVF